MSAYLMEWSLSIDNIFVFILIFSFLRINEKFFGRVLLIGILLAVFFRIIFITAGIELVSRFSWLLYIFGAILIYTGLTMFFAKKEEDGDLEKNRVYRFLKAFSAIDPRRRRMENLQFAGTGKNIIPPYLLLSCCWLQPISYLPWIPFRPFSG